MSWQASDSRPHSIVVTYLLLKAKRLERSTQEIVYDLKGVDPVWSSEYLEFSEKKIKNWLFTHTQT